jgi:hypothetical protein
MKTLSILLILALCTIKCTKIPDAAQDVTTNNVKISLDYAFPSHSGDMTTKDQPIYLDFYNKYIIGKILTPKTYILLFSGQTNSFVTSATGKWGDKEFISLPPDKYVVDGTSVPTKYDIAGDTCYLTFHDTVDVTATTSNILLTAKYNCSLLLFDTTDVTSTLIQSDNSVYNDKTLGYTFKTSMLKTEEFYSTFLLAGDYTGWQYGALDIYLYGRNNKQVYFGTWKYSFKPGKYYYFSSTDNSYTLVPMTDSNVLLPAVNNH